MRVSWCEISIMLVDLFVVQLCYVLYWFFVGLQVCNQIFLPATYFGGYSLVFGCQTQSCQGKISGIEVQHYVGMIQSVQYIADLSHEIAIAHRFLPLLQVVHTHYQLEIEANRNHEVDFCFEYFFEQTFDLLFQILSFDSPPFSQYLPAFLQNIDRILQLLCQFAGEQDGSTGVDESIELMIGGDFGMGVEDEECELDDLAGSGCSGESAHDALDELSDVSCERVVSGCLWFVGEQLHDKQIQQSQLHIKL